MTGPQLHQFRDRLNLSLAEMSQRLGIDVATLCRWQNSRKVRRVVEMAVLHLECERNHAKGEV